MPATSVASTPELLLLLLSPLLLSLSSLLSSSPLSTPSSSALSVPLSALPSSSSSPPSPAPAPAPLLPVLSCTSWHVRSPLSPDSTASYPSGQLSQHRPS